MLRNGDASDRYKASSNSIEAAKSSTGHNERGKAFVDSFFHLCFALGMTLWLSSQHRYDSSNGLPTSSAGFAMRLADAVSGMPLISVLHSHD